MVSYGDTNLTRIRGRDQDDEMNRFTRIKEKSRLQPSENDSLSSHVCLWICVRARWSGLHVDPSDFLSSMKVFMLVVYLRSEKILPGLLSPSTQHTHLFFVVPKEKEKIEGSEKIQDNGVTGPQVLAKRTLQSCKNVFPVTTRDSSTRSSMTY
eukprot:g43623.t1